MLFIQQKKEGLLFKVFVQPRASRNVIAGLQGEALKIKITAPPTEGAANKMCIEFLAKCLKVPKSALKITAGHKSRHKQILIKDERISPEHLHGLIKPT